MQTVDEIGLLEAFDALVRHGSLLGASRELDISRSALLRRIDRLEKRLGYTVIHRDEAGSRPTVQGEVFLQKARNVLKVFRSATSLDPTEDTQTTLHISVPYSLGTTLVLPWVADYKKLHPKICFDVDLTLGPQRLLPTICDLRFSHGAIPSERVLSRELGLMPRIVAASPGYIDRFGTPKDPTELVNHSLLGSQDTVGQSSFLLRKGEEVIRLPFHPQIRVQDHNSGKVAAKAGLGIALHILKHDADNELARGELVQVLPDWTPEPCPINLLIPLSHPMSKATEQFAEFVEECWRNHPVLLPPEAEAWQ